MKRENCYCGSGKAFQQCCGAIIDGTVQAKTALDLMKSRYSAYASGAIEYLIATTHHSTRHLYKKEEIAQWATENQWLKLEIVSATLGGIPHDRGEVVFKAWHQPKGKQPTAHYEHSFFVKEEGQWYYQKGINNPREEGDYTKTGRNDPCPCGSGKKYKKCCG